MNLSTTNAVPEGPGSVSGAPNLPEGFTETFTSRYIDSGDVRLHAVVGGDGPPLLLIHGWPGSWYYWRLVMPALARDYTVIAVDQRGIGLSDKPEDGYDTATPRRRPGRSHQRVPRPLPRGSGSGRRFGNRLAERKMDMTTIDNTQQSGRRWYHLRPQPRRRTDLMGISSTVWMALGWILIIALAVLPYPWW